MAWDQKILPDAFLASAISVASAAADGVRESAYMSHVQAGISTSWKRQLLRDDVVVYEGTGSGLIPFTGRTFTVPAVTKTTISNADIDTGEWIHRVINASDATKYVANKVTKTGGVGTGFRSDDLVNPNAVSWGTFTMTGPTLDSLSVSPNTPASVTSSSFTLSATISGTIPPGSVAMIQWIDNRATGIWRESPAVTAVPGVFSYAFTGAPADTLITWRVFVYTAPATIHAQSAEVTFRTSVAVSSAWLDSLRDSMLVQNVTERFTSGDNYGRIIGSDGSPVPFPDSYANYTSHAGIQASLEGRSTGLGSEVTSWNGITLTPAGPNILNFPAGVDSAGIWSWWTTKTGHAAPNSKLHVSDMFFAVFRESTRTWQTLFTGMRVSGVRYYSMYGSAAYGAGEDLTTNPNETILTIPNGYNIEAWCKPTASNPEGYRDFFGKVDREAFADSRTWCIGVKVRVEGPDRSNARFIGTVGLDHYRSDHYGDASRYWPSQYPAYVGDSGGGEWQNIRNDGLDQWVFALGCFELARFKANRPPWGSWNGVWPYSSAPLYGPSWSEIQGNPPPDLRATASFPLPSDTRTIAYLDPALPWASQNAAVPGGYGGDLWPQFNNDWFVGAANNPPTSGNRTAQIPEVGLSYSGITVIDRLADPADGAKQAFLHRLHPSVPTFAGSTARSAYLTPDYLPYNTDLWVAFAIRFSGWPGKTTTFFDVHDVAGQPMPGNPSRVSPHTQSPVQCWITSDGRCTWGVNGSYLPNYTAGQTTNSLQTPTAPVSAGSGIASGWHRYVIQFRAARSQATGPFCRIWRQIDNGAETLLHDISGVPVGYYDTPTDKLFAKLGLYQFELPASDFTAHTKGLYVFRGQTATPSLTPSGLFAMLREK